MIRITPDKKNEIITRYNSSSHFYDKRYTQIQYEKYDLIIKENSLRDKVIIDAGAGTGLLIQYIEKNIEIKNYLYIALDISWNMLLILKEKIKTINKRVRNKLSIVLTDLENLPFRENSFNSLFALTSLQNLPNITKGVKSLLRVAKNNAIFNLSILKKKVYKKEFSSVLHTMSKDLTIIEKDSLEDIIFQGFFKK